MMKKVIAMGESLIDFMPIGENEFAAKPGGAPANVCACEILHSGSNPACVKTCVSF